MKIKVWTFVDTIMPGVVILVEFQSVANLGSRNEVRRCMERHVGQVRHNCAGKDEGPCKLYQLVPSIGKVVVGLLHQYPAVTDTQVCSSRGPWEQDLCVLGGLVDHVEQLLRHSNVYMPI